VVKAREYLVHFEYPAHQGDELRLSGGNEGNDQLYTFRLSTQSTQHLNVAVGQRLFHSLFGEQRLRRRLWMVLTSGLAHGRA
jgi:hypothetical protein